MCGIAGFSDAHGTFASRPAPPEEQLARARSALLHRGPDSSGLLMFDEQGVGLAHTRLAIQDLSASGHQPMVSTDGSAAIVFNGEIYNFPALRQELESRGHRFEGHSDTEVLLALYVDARKHRRDLDAVLRSLNGIFAFAIWDGLEECLLVVRDGLGVKPLYYAQAEDRFAFASEIKALQHLVPASTEADAASIDRYLTFLWCPGAGTPLKQVRKLEPGQLLRIRRGSVVEQRTWYRLPTFDRPHRELTASQAIEGVRHHLRQAVHRQLISDVPVGAFLSGGLDSSSLVAFAREVQPDIRCFTIDTAGGDEGFVDDLPFAREVASKLQVPLEVVSVDSHRMAGDLAAMVEHLDEPLADPACLNVLYISRLARANGIKVLLSGAGGDDLFTGYRRHAALAAEKYWKWMPNAVLQAAARAARGLDQRTALGRRIRKVAEGGALRGDARLANYFHWIGRDDLDRLYTPEFRMQIREAADAPVLDYLAKLPASTPDMSRLLCLEQRFFLTDHNLAYTDKMSMATGVEVRVPFLDLDLVEFANAIPPAYKQRGSVGKWVLKKAMEPYLPHKVIYRRKSGFGVPLRRWLRHELKDLLNDVLSESSLRRRGWFDGRAVQSLIARNASGQVDASYTLLALLCIELWCRRFLDVSPQQEPAGELACM